jgi:hypothetical protein
MNKKAKWEELRAAAELLLARDFLIGRPFDPSSDGDLKRLRLAIEALEK